MLFRERPFCVDVVLGKFYVEEKAKAVVFQAKCLEEYTQRFRLKQSLNWSVSSAKEEFALAECERSC